MNRLFALELAGLHHAAHILIEFGRAVHEIGDDEALHPHAHPDQPREIAQLGGLSIVIDVDHAADREPRMCVGDSKRRIEMIAADIVEIDVDPARSRLRQLLHQRRAAILVIDHRVGAERLDPGAFVRAPGRADHRHALGLGDLHHRRSHRAGRGRHEHHVARLGAGHVEQAEIARHARHAELPQEGLHRHAEIGQLLYVGAIDHRFVAPAHHVLHHVTGLQAIGVAFDHFADRAALHRRADLERRDIAFHIVHPAAHIGIDRQPAVGDANLPFAKAWRLDRDQLEIRIGRHPLRA